MRDAIARDWRAFLLTKPSMPEWSDWIWLKAAEHELDPFALSAWLILSVQRPSAYATLASGRTEEN